MSGRTQPWGSRMVYPDPIPETRWSARRSLAFILTSSIGLWSALLAAGQFLSQS